MGRTPLKNEFNATPSLQEMNALTRAAVDGNNADIQAFLDKFPKHINDGGVIGWPALIWATAYGHKDTVTLLLERGADIEAKSRDGMTPLMKAAETGYKGLVELFLAKGADIEAKDNSDRTVLMYAQKNSRADVREFLQERVETRRRERELAEDIADFSPALKRNMRAMQPFKPRKAM